MHTDSGRFEWKFRPDNSRTSNGWAGGAGTLPWPLHRLLCRPYGLLCRPFPGRNLPLTFVNGDTGTFEHEGTLRAIEQKGSGIGGVHERALHASWTCYGRARQLGEGYVLPDSEVKGTYC